MITNEDDLLMKTNKRLQIKITDNKKKKQMTTYLELMVTTETTD